LVSLLQDFVIIWIWMTFTSQVGASTFGLTGMTASTPLDRSLDTSSYSCMFGLARLASPSQHHFQIVPRLPWFLVHQMRACYNLLMPLHCHAHLKLEQTGNCTKRCNKLRTNLHCTLCNIQHWTRHVSTLTSHGRALIFCNVQLIPLRHSSQRAETQCVLHTTFAWHLQLQLHVGASIFHTSK
jgi:hypothetical protein